MCVQCKVYSVLQAAVCTLYSVKSTLRCRPLCVECTVYNVQYSVLQEAVCTVYFKVYCRQLCEQCTVYCRQLCAQCTVYNIQCTAVSCVYIVLHAAV